MSKDMMDMVCYFVIAVLFYYCYYFSNKAKANLIDRMYDEIRNLGEVKEPTHILYKSASRWSVVWLIGFFIHTIKFFHSF